MARQTHDVLLRRGLGAFNDGPKVMFDRFAFRGEAVVENDPRP